jgi:hypothetical protein
MIDDDYKIKSEVRGYRKAYELAASGHLKMRKWPA